MIFKYALLALYSLTMLVSDGALAQSYSYTEPTIAEIMDLLRKYSQFHQRSGDVYQSESNQEPSRMKPIAAPPPAPALGDIVSPVAWPYPPAPNTGGANEFPLLERFMKSNNIESNNQISNTPSQSSWSPVAPPPAQPAPAVVPTPSSAQWSQPQPQNNLNSYLEYGLLQPQSKSMSAVQSLPPPLNPEDHFHIQHNQNPGQQRHFRLDSVRVADTSENRNKLNVSFIMPPDMKPLTLNFDTGEVMVDTGDKQQPGQMSAGYSDLDTIIKNSRLTHSPKSSESTGAVITQLGTNSRAVENDDDYIVVRHDMNKYAYDLPKAMPASGAASSAATGGTQDAQVEKFDVSGHKALRFTLGRVSV